jgi:secreted trypsin-like serine protease
MNAALGADTFFIYGFGCTLPIQPTGQFKGCNSDSLGVKMTGFVTFSANCTDPNACAPGGREFALRDIGSSAPIDTCGGDSGGPVIIIGSQTDALVYHLVGITSRPFNPNGNCGDGGIYGKVGTDEVIDWLKTHVAVQN